MSISRREFIAASMAAGLAPAPARASASAPAPTRSSASAPPGRACVPDATLAPPQRFDPWIEVDAAALAWNLGEVRRLSARPVLAVVKNDAYGLGLALTARLLEPMDGIAGFAVVRTAEAIALRDAGIRKPILLMARVDERDVPDLVARDIELAVFADDDVTRLAPGDRAPAARPHVHFYIDSGMGRMGIPYHRALPLLREVSGGDAFVVRGTFTEFAEDAEFDREQLRRFHGLLDEAKRSNLPLGQLHAASSNGIFHLPDAHLDLVRPGIALYGGYPSRPDEERAMATLRPAVRLRARVVRVERLRPGDSVSYGRHYIAERPVWVATLPVGHSDGYPREAVEGARVRIGAGLYPVIGAVSASHCIVEIGEEPAVRLGDVATLVGDEDPAIHPNGVAEATGVSVYDIFMHLNPGLPRIQT